MVAEGEDRRVVVGILAAVVAAIPAVFVPVVAPAVFTSLVLTGLMLAALMTALAMLLTLFGALFWTLVILMDGFGGYRLNGWRVGRGQDGRHRCRLGRDTLAPLMPPTALIAVTAMGSLTA